MDTSIQLPTRDECNKKLGKSWYEKRYPKFIALLDQIYPQDYKFREKMYLYFNNLKERPKCIMCGKNVSFRGTTIGYSKYCGSKCTAKSDTTRDKIKQTCLERYGVENPSQLDSIKKKKEETCLERYGVDNVFKSDLYKDKIKQTLLERYGVEYAQQSYQIQETRKNNCLERYGVDHHMKVDDIKSKIQKTHQQSFIDDKQFLIGYTENGDWICKCPHSECNKCNEKYYIISNQNYHGRKEFNIEPCTRLHPIQRSRKEGTEIEKFIRNILEKNNIDYESNNRSILAPLELDIYIPSKNIAIECNGCFWHSQQNNKPLNYHINKFKQCLDKGVQLITFWEDQIKNKPEIIESILLSKLGLITTKIGARKCIIKEIHPKESSNFLNHNHIQGRTNSSLRLGLYYNDQLISLMTFSKRKNNIWELSRFCNKIGLHVVGGASRLLNYFIKKYNPSTIYSFASNDISNGNLYKILGFIKDDKISNSYWYIHKKELKRYHRSNFSKTKLKNKGYDIINKTEPEIMSQLPYWKIYDSGHVKYTLNIT